MKMKMGVLGHLLAVSVLCLGVSAAAVSVSGCAALGTAAAIASQIEVPAIAAIETVHAVSYNDSRADLEERLAAGTSPSLAELEAAERDVAKAQQRLGVARTAYDVSPLGQAASVHTRHLIDELRGATDAAYAKLQAAIVGAMAAAPAPAADPAAPGPASLVI